MIYEVLSNSLRGARGSLKIWLLGEAADRTATRDSVRVSTSSGWNGFRYKHLTIPEWPCAFVQQLLRMSARVSMQWRSPALL